MVGEPEISIQGLVSAALHKAARTIIIRPHWETFRHELDAAHRNYAGCWYLVVAY